MTTQKPEIGKILTEAYQYWIRTLPFQLLFTVLYFSIFMFFSMYAFRYYGLFEEIQKFQNLFYSDTKVFLNKYEELMQTENAQYFAMVVIVIKSVLFPLNIGFLKIYRKLDLGDLPQMSDLFAGFRGHYFFLFAIYALFWNIINNYLLFFTILWIPMLLMIPSLVFFKNYNFFLSFRISVSVFRNNVLLLLLATLASIIISYSGLVMFFFGIFVTFPFWNAVIYVLYKHLVADFQE
ncbi:hypothetical protein [Epilithonimonas mollis]|uniref:Beta-carotene 15,15'-monooxygenase n=1 Tax=Epilithonimonas mollis TaxID=216903 RepID=A0A1M6Q1T4_9FLAO|nr:hypothetical protein [Epilithonimonas mollis]SHK14180.1 hypothetical protein SAMN05444371_1467 [Epilithonimonas mollis]